MKKECARGVYSGCACAVTVHVRTRAIPRGVHAYTRANARPHGVPVHTSGETRERREAGALRAIGHLTNMAVPLFLTNTTAKHRVNATYRDVCTARPKVHRGNRSTRVFLPVHEITPSSFSPLPPKFQTFSPIYSPSHFPFRLYNYTLRSYPKRQWGNIVFNPICILDKTF